MTGDDLDVEEGPDSCADGIPAWLLSPERVVELHTKAIDLWGGDRGVDQPGCVERSIGAAANAALYLADDGDEPDVLTVAAHLLFYLARNHCFSDGNKRVGWMAAVDQLLAVGLDINATPDDTVEFVLRIAENQATTSEVVQWIAIRLTAANQPLS